MTYKKLMLLALVLLISPAFAGGGGAPPSEEQMSVFNDTWETIHSEGQEWAATGEVMGRTASDSLFGWIYQEGSCDDPWAGYTATNLFGVAQLYNVLRVIFVVLMALAILYMIGQFLQSPKIIASVKDNLFGMIIPIAAMVTFIGLMHFANLWYEVTVDSDALAADPFAFEMYDKNPNMMDLGMAYSRLMIYKISADLTSLAIFNSVIHTLYTSTLWFGLTWRAMWSFNLGPALKPIIDILGSAMQFLGVALGEWIVHLIILCIIKKWTWGVLIPVGFLLYMLPHTRSAGAGLLSLMFSLSLIYPLMFVANYEIYRITSTSIMDNTYVANTFFEQSGLSELGLLTVALVFMMAGVLMPFFAGAAISMVFELLRNAIYYIVIISLLLPFINIFVTLTSAREFARSLGANVNFMSFMRLV